MTHRNALTLAAAAAAFTLAGCSQQAPEVLAMKIELNALKAELEYVRQQAEELDPRVRTAEQMALQVIAERAAPHRLDCTDRAPGVVAARLAALATVCDGAEPSADGYRIRLRLGNPTPAQIDGVKLTLYAGEGAAEGQSDRRIYHEATVSLAPGAWAAVDVEFAGLDAASARNLALRADVANIVLAGTDGVAAIRARR
jgi:hypothetical protein